MTLPAWTQAVESAFSIERMGAGPPAGWQVEKRECDWTAETGSGPLGVGAARLKLGKDGRLELVSPAQRLKAGGAYIGAFWIRSEPAGATADFRVYDNESEREIAFKEKRTVASETWQLVVWDDTAPKTPTGAYYVSFTVTGNDCTVWLDGLWFGESPGKIDQDWRPPVHRAGVTLQPEQAWGLVTGNEPLRVQACAVGANQPGCALRLRVVHVDGHTGDLPTIPLDTTGIWTGNVDVAGDIAQRYGMMRVEATVVAADGAACSPVGETLLARVPEPIPGPRPDSAFGVHVSLREPDLSVVAKLGYKWCRIHDASGITKWGYVEPEQGRWMWYDDQVALARSHGLCIVGMLDGSPPWESGSTEEGYFRIYTAPGNIENWRTYVRQVVAHYAGAIDEWEVWNEPWDMKRFFQNGSPAKYAELLKAAYEEAKTANPKCTILGVDTYPPLWETAVLAYGAYPYYDLLSWHRYDPCLHGRPNDAIARVADRLRKAQAPYGPPKPTLCTEGGPENTLFHGSLFSFADPAIVGEWSRGTDQYPRMFLSTIAAGHKRFIAYSVHNCTRHGRQTVMMTEPGYLLRPMHLGLAALAYFVEGAAYESRLAPAQDISAHVFNQADARPYSDGPSTVVVLAADGDDPEDLPKPIPSGVRCFDRWGNPTPTPTQATRSLAFLVADAVTRPTLLDALRGEPEPATNPKTVQQGVATLLDNTITALTTPNAPLWTLLSAQGALVVARTDAERLLATRLDLRSDRGLAAKLELPTNTKIGSYEITPGGPFAVGAADLNSDNRHWDLTFAAVHDGPNGAWRYTALTLTPVGPEADSVERERVAAVIKKWEQALLKCSTDDLYDTVSAGPCCFTAATVNGEYMVFNRPEQLIRVLNTVATWGAAATSAMTFSKVAVSGDVATVVGRWDLASLAFGMAPYAITATLVRSEAGWKIAALCCSAGAS